VTTVYGAQIRGPLAFFDAGNSAWSTSFGSVPHVAMIEIPTNFATNYLRVLTKYPV
jgi:hypothetical protein